MPSLGSKGYQVVKTGHFTTSHLLHKIPSASCGSWTLRRVTARNHHPSLCSNGEWPLTGKKTFPLQESGKEDEDEKESKEEKKGISQRGNRCYVSSWKFCIVCSTVFFHSLFFSFLPSFLPNSLSFFPHIFFFLFLYPFLSVFLYHCNVPDLAIWITSILFDCDKFWGNKDEQFVGKTGRRKTKWNWLFFLINFARIWDDGSLFSFDKNSILHSFGRGKWNVQRQELLFPWLFFLGIIN